MTDRSKDGPALPPRPGAKGGAPTRAGAESVIVEVQGQEFQMGIADALALAGVITATVEIYLRSRG